MTTSRRWPNTDVGWACDGQNNLVNAGTMEIGPSQQTRSFIRVLDEGGLIWKGRRRYRSLDAALADAEAGVAKWMRDELGIKAATHT